MIELTTRAFGPWVRWVNRQTLRADLIAGILGALLVLPQGFAFATLAGLPPEYGLYTAIVPCVVAALFCSSWLVVSGPTNANSLALFAARTPLAAVFASAWLLLLLAFTAPLLALIPLPAISALLLVVAWSLLDIAGWQRLWRHSRQDFAIAAVTALATMTIRIEMVILLGTVLSLITYLYRTRVLTYA